MRGDSSTKATAGALRAKPQQPMQRDTIAPRPYPAELDGHALENLYSLEDECDTSVLQELVEIFCQDAPIALLSMRQAAAESDFKQLAFLAHTLKTNAATLGAKDLSALAKTVERLAFEERDANLTQLLAEAEAEFARAKSSLEQLVWERSHQPSGTE